MPVGLGCLVRVGVSVRGAEGHGKARAWLGQGRYEVRRARVEGGAAG